jgi:hypothetical protein
MIDLEHLYSFSTSHISTEFFMVASFSLSSQQNWFHVNQSSGVFSILKKKKKSFGLKQSGPPPGTAVPTTGPSGAHRPWRRCQPGTV